MLHFYIELIDFIKDCHEEGKPFFAFCSYVDPHQSYNPPPPYSEHMKLFTTESWELLSSELAKTRELGVPYELELETVRKDKSRGWMWLRGEAVFDINKKIWCF